MPLTNDLKRGLIAAIEGDAGVAALVSDRVFFAFQPVDLGEAEFPLVSVWDVGVDPILTDQGNFGGQDQLWAIESYSRDSDEVNSVDDAIRDALLPAGFTATGWRVNITRLSGSNRDYDDETLVHRKISTWRTVALVA